LSEDAPLRAAIDVTPLLSFRTGIGYAVAGMWEALRALPAGPTMVPYALGLRPAPAPEDVPGRLHRVRAPTRGLLAAWARVDWPPVDRWIGTVDLIHTTNYLTPPSRHPTLMTVNDIGFVHWPSSDPVVAAFPAVLRRAIRRGAHVHVATAQVGTEVEEAFGPGLLAAGRISVVPYGVPRPDHTGTRSHDRGDLVGSRPYLLALGSDEERKNLPRLVDAFGRVAGYLPDLLLVLAGPSRSSGGPVAAAVDALPPPVRARVVRTGAVSSRTRTELLRGAHLLAYVSTYEGFGFPILEAMAAGVPVLASDVAALREVAGGAAELADPIDADAIADRILLVSTDDTRRTGLVAAGRARAAMFSWESTAAGLVAAYHHLLASSGDR